MMPFGQFNDSFQFMPNILIPSLTNDLNLYLWEINEPLEWFEPQVKLTSDEDLEYSSILGKRKFEYIVQRFLLQKYLSGANPLMKKTSNGKPFLINHNKKISISHSKNMLLLSTASLDHGVDLEWIDKRILRLTSKFCSIEEMKVPEGIDPVIWFTLIWSSKESLYKVDGLGQLEFRTQIAVNFTAESFNQGWGRGIVERGDTILFFKINFSIINGFVVSWAYPAIIVKDRNAYIETDFN